MNATVRHMSRLPIVPWVPFVATLLTGCSASSSSPIVNGTPPPGPSGTDVVTYHYDNQRSGENLKETTLNPGNVNSATFGKVGEFAVDGQIDGQTLFLSQLGIPGQGNKDVLYLATENDTVYAVDAQSISGSSATILWKTSVLPGGESPGTSLPCGNIRPNGITATPVIDRARNAIYVEAMSQNPAGNIVHRLHALDLTNGSELFGGPTTITASFPGTGGNSSGGVVTFLPPVHHERAALLEAGSTIYTAWAGLFGDCGAYSAWVIAYDAGTLKQTGAIDLVPNNSGGGMWMGGGGPAADAAGNVYVISGNGFADTPGANHSYGNSFVRLSTSGGLTVGDYFTPYNTSAEDSADEDFGSAGPLLLPDLTDAGGIVRHLAVGAGKDGNLYVLNRDNLGQFNSTKNNIYQPAIQLSTGENHSSPVFFNNTVYICPTNNALKAFPVSQALLGTLPSSESAHLFGSNGAVPSISANGASQGIVWTLDWERESYLRTTPATLPRNFTTRTRRLQTEIIFLRSAGISLRRWSQTAGSMSALRPASPYLACGELRLQCRVSSAYPSHLPEAVRQDRRPAADRRGIFRKGSAHRHCLASDLTS